MTILETILFVFVCILFATGLWLGYMFHTAPCESFKSGPLSYGYAPARCVVK